ncbi:hypothetical protein quinque_001416 [Culex quinquefasciatus]
MKCLLLVVGLVGLAVSVSANFCFVCSTQTDPSCLIPEGAQLMRDCNVIANNNTCYTRIVARPSASCAADVANQGRCNGAVFPEHRLHCHQCSGSINSTCGQEIVTAAQLCRFYDADDQCFVSVVGDLVERGCLSESDFCRVGQTCHTCDGPRL